MSEPVLAAGGVPWRRNADDGVLVVGVVHRPRYDDWTFPKGKRDPEELLPVTAVRELAEETGFQVELGRHLAITSYVAQGREKLVHYWSARIVAGAFTVNDEVDQLRWVTPEAAHTLLSYPHDQQVLQGFTALPADTSTLLLVRHAKAGSRKHFHGDDRLRPLEAAGRRQAAALVPLLRSFGANTVHAGDRVRCVQTVQPLADELGVPVASEPALTDDAYLAHPEWGRQRITEIAASGGTPVVCSQGSAIPRLLSWWAERDDAVLPPSHNRKAGTWVVSLCADHVVAIDHLDAPFR